MEKVRVSKLEFKNQIIELPFAIEVTKPFTSNKGTLIEIMVGLIKGFLERMEKCQDKD